MYVSRSGGNKQGVLVLGSFTLQISYNVIPEQIGLHLYVNSEGRKKNKKLFFLDDVLYVGGGR